MIYIVGCEVQPGLLKLLGTVDVADAPAALAYVAPMHPESDVFFAVAATQLVKSRVTGRAPTTKAEALNPLTAL